jgi:hypothetical protein
MHSYAARLSEFYHRFDEKNGFAARVSHMHVNRLVIIRVKEENKTVALENLGHFPTVVCRPAPSTFAPAELR